MKRALALVLLASTGCTPAGAPYRARDISHPAGDARPVWLAEHNRERAAYGSAPLSWNAALAAEAGAYAARIARLGRLQHSPKAERPGQGENLWMGSRGAYSPGAMIAGWASERRHFRRGVFPAVSSTGNWRDVGHYTQMVWPRTTLLGCGMASSARWDVLVCRYAPPGNRDGERI